VLLVNLVELVVERVIVGAPGDAVVGVWASPQVVTCHSVAPSPPGTRGVVILEELPATALGRELARAIPGARLLPPVRPLVVPDEDGEVSDALELVRAGAWTRALALHGAGLHIVLAAAMDARATDVLQARAASPGDDALEEVLVRAARLGAGDASSADDFDGFALDPATLNALGYRILTLNGHRGRSGPMDPEAPLPTHRM
jgi:hypothetical protein